MMHREEYSIVLMHKKQHGCEESNKTDISYQKMNVGVYIILNLPHK